MDSRKDPLTETAVSIELRINDHLAKIEATADTPIEKATVTEIHDLLRPYYAKIGAASRTSKNDEKSTPSTARNLANQISDKAAQISDIDHDLLGAAAERRLRIGSRIFWGRDHRDSFRPADWGDAWLSFHAVSLKRSPKFA